MAGEEQTLTDLNNAYTDHHAARWLLIEAARSNGSPDKVDSGLAERLATAEDLQLTALQQLLPSRTHIHVPYASIFPDMEAHSASRTIVDKVVTVHDIGMYADTQRQRFDITRAPFARISPDSSEGIWLQRLQEYTILSSGLVVAFSGLRYTLSQPMLSHRRRMAELFSQCNQG